MSKKVVFWLAGLVALVALSLGAYTANYFLEPGLGSNELDRGALEKVGAFVYDSPQPVVKFQLDDLKGNPFDNQSLKGQWSFVFFGYTHCPDICPGTMLAFQALRAELAERGELEAQLIMVTVDPERDTTSSLAEYLSFFNPNYIGLTGHEAIIRAFARSLNAGFSIPPHQPGENYFVDHSAHISLINPRGEFVAFFQMPHNAKVMATVLQALKD